MAERTDDFTKTNVEKPRNENLTGGKSTQAHPEEAQVEQIFAEHGKQEAGKQVDEIKAAKNILPEDARKKSADSGTE